MNRFESNRVCLVIPFPSSHSISTSPGAFSIYSRQENKSLLCAKQIEKCFALEEKLGGNCQETRTEFYLSNVSPLEEAAFPGQHGSSSSSSSSGGSASASQANFFLRESTRCLVEFVFCYLPKATDLGVDALNKEIFRILGETASKIQGKSVQVVSVEDAKLAFLPFVDQLEKAQVETIKEHHGRLAALAKTKGAEWCEKYVAAINPTRK